MGNCGKCHECGTDLKKVLDGEEWCPRCGQYRRYSSHGWAPVVAEVSSCLPSKGDYVAMIGVDGQLSGNFTRVERVIEWKDGIPLPVHLPAQGIIVRPYQVEDPSGEVFIVARMPEEDNEIRRAWREVYTGKAQAV